MGIRSARKITKSGNPVLWETQGAALALDATDNSTALEFVKFMTISSRN